MSARIFNGNPRFHVLAGLLVALSAMPVGCSACGDRSYGTPEAIAHNKEGVEHLDEGDYEKAVASFKNALTLDPIYAAAKANLGWALHKRGFSDEGIKSAKDAIETDPDEALGYFTLGEIYRDQKRYKEAEVEYKRALEVLPDLQGGNGWIALGDNYEAQGKRDKALESYLEATRVNEKNVEAHLKAGRLYFENGVFEDAERRFEIGLKNDPTSPLGCQGMGLIRLKTEKWVEAIQWFKRGLKGAPKGSIAEAQLKKSLAETYKEARKRPVIAETILEAARGTMGEAAALKGAKRNEALDEAMQDLEAAAEVNPQNADVAETRVECLLAYDPPKVLEALKAAKDAYARFRSAPNIRFALAYAHLHAAQKLGADELKKLGGRDLLLNIAEQTLRDLLKATRRTDPEKAKYHKYLGIAYSNQREFRKAEREYLTCLSLAEGDEEAKALIQQLYRAPRFQEANELDRKGVQALKEKDLAQADTLFRGARQLDRQFAVAIAHLAETLIAARDLATARQFANEAISVDPDVPNAHLQLGTIEFEEGKLDAARKCFDNAAALDPNWIEPPYRLGLLHKRLKKPKEAEKAFQAAIDINAKDPRCHYELALLHRASALTQNAEDELNLALLYDPRHVPSRVELGRIQLERKRYTEAIETFVEAGKLDPDAPEPLVGLGEAYTATGERGRAVTAYLYAAMAYFGQQKFDEAEKVAKRALDMDDKRADAHDVYGQALSKKGRYAEALAELRKADELDPKDVTHRITLAGIYEAMGDHARAAGTYRDIVRDQPLTPNPIVLERLALLHRKAKTIVGTREAIESLRKARAVRMQMPKGERDEAAITEGRAYEEELLKEKD